MFSDKNAICDGCGLEFYVDDMYVVNDEFDDRRVECQDCHNFQMESSDEVMCGSCFEYFDLVHAEGNGDLPTCPYCGEKLDDYML